MTFYKNMTKQERNDVIVSNIRIESSALPEGSALIIPSCRLGDLENKVHELLMLSEQL